MASKTLYVAAAALFAAVGINAQAAPNWNYIPSSCSSQCAQTVETSYLCSQQYPNDSLNTYACYCSSFPSDASGCASCLNSNNAGALGSLVTSTITQCPTDAKSCAFSCSFDTCASSDVACQCSATYLSAIYDCGSCNTANGNTQATQLKDWQSLKDSCANQNYTGAAQSFTTKAPPTPTGKAAYQAPALTASGGGAAATGDASMVGFASGAAGAAGPTGSSPSPAAGNASAPAASKASTAAAGGASAVASKAAGGASSVASGAGAPAAAASSKSAALNVIAPAGGLLALFGGLVALL